MVRSERPTIADHTSHSMTCPSARRKVVAPSSANTRGGYANRAGWIAYCSDMPTDEVTKLIEISIRERRVLRIRYRSADGHEALHTIEPLGIRFNRAQHRVLYCWTRDVGHIEELLWDGVENAVATGETFEPRPWADPEAET